MQMMKVDALSGSEKNARLLRDAIMAMPEEHGPPRLVLMGYSKGTPDILEAVVNYPGNTPANCRGRQRRGGGGWIVACGGRNREPGRDCAPFPRRDLRCRRPRFGEEPAYRVRRQWLREHPLPRDVRYYSLVTLPDRNRISRILVRSYDKLAKVDVRNDSQVIYYDEFIPGSELLGFINADHWAIALPIKRSHAVVSTMSASHNDYPREALLEAVLRYVEEDLGPGGP